MYLKYHRLIIQQALQNVFGATALQAIIKANIFKDDLISNLFKPEHHPSRRAGRSTKRVSYCFNQSRKFQDAVYIRGLDYSHLHPPELPGQSPRLAASRRIPAEIVIRTVPVVTRPPARFG